MKKKDNIYDISAELAEKFGEEVVKAELNL